MNDTHKEITQLHEHVSQLYTVVQQLSEYVGWQDISNLNLSFDSNSTMKLTPSSYQNDNHSLESEFTQRHTVRESLSLLNQHQDVLIDDESVHTFVIDHNHQSEDISCEEQVHRLTAQLTAAYYRIASLEEQLLAIRNNVEIGESSFYQC